MVSSEQILNKIIFRPYRAGMGPTFRLITWDTYQTGYGGKSILGYRLTMHPADGSRRVVLFRGEDFGCSPMHAIDSRETVRGIMSFLTLRPGDTDSEYFDSYTRRQLAYCTEHAENLGAYVSWKLGDG